MGLGVEYDVEMKPVRCDTHTAGCEQERLDVGQRNHASRQLRPRRLKVFRAFTSDDHLKVDIAPRIRIVDGEAADQVGGEDPLVCGEHLPRPLDKSFLSGRCGRKDATEWITM